MNQQGQNIYAYVGTYTGSGSKGIYLYTLNTNSGQFTPTGHCSESQNASFLAIDADQHYLYSVSESNDGQVVSFRINEATKELTRINSQSSRGMHPCHMSVNREGTFLFAVNYSGGSVCLYPIHEDGSIAEISDFIQHEGHGPRADRQESPHPHSIFIDPSNQWILVPDLGLDTIFIYGLDTVQQKFIAHRQVKLRPATGPRHLAFHPTAPYVYVINELDSTITAFNFDASLGDLVALQSISTLPENFTGISTCADIHTSPCGRFLYGSNRGDDSIAVYRIDSSSGLLTLIEIVSTGGQTPRNFAIAPDGKFLLAANQDSDNIVIFSIDQETGRLHNLNLTVDIAKPVCIKFLD
jgi:6-phosphogluconolactonase